MNPALVGLMVGGYGLQAYGQYQQSKAQAASLLDQAHFKDLYAAETQRRAEETSLLMTLEAKQVQGKQTAAFAGAGVDITSQSALAVHLQTAKTAARNIDSMMKQAQYEISLAQAEAASLREQAKQTKKAGKFAALGTLVGGASSLAK